MTFLNRINKFIDQSRKKIKNNVLSSKETRAFATETATNIWTAYKELGYKEGEDEEADQIDHGDEDEEDEDDYYDEEEEEEEEEEEQQPPPQPQPQQQQSQQQQQQQHHEENEEEIIHMYSEEEDYEEQSISILNASYK